MVSAGAPTGFDHIVVGGGAAGSVVAARLSEIGERGADLLLGAT